MQWQLPLYEIPRFNGGINNVYRGSTYTLYRTGTVYAAHSNHARAAQARTPSEDIRTCGWLNATDGNTSGRYVSHKTYS